MTRPDGICPNCFATWTARRPRPPAAWCWHSATVAWPAGDGWRIESAKGRAMLERLRAEGIR
ncbi:MAG: hypothetical protein ACYDAE_00325 [Steroidobacteraceae bacterium]